MHDQVSTSKQNPTVNGGGTRLCSVRRSRHSGGSGSEDERDERNRNPDTCRIDRTIGSRFPPPNPPSLWWGDARLWNGPTYDPSDPHNPMMDNKGRVWLTSKIRQPGSGMVLRCNDSTSRLPTIR